jgi:hypothetical protein
MKTTLIVVLAVSAGLFVLDSDVTRAQSAGPVATVAWGGMAVGNPSNAPVEGAPYSATITVKSVRTLADGNQIIQSSVGAAARDSQGRTREEPPVPSGPANVPRLAFIQDPVAHTGYALNSTDKTAQKIPVAGGVPGAENKNFAIGVMQAGVGTAGATFSTSEFPATLGLREAPSTNRQQSTEDLGSRTIEGLSVTGVRTTETIPAGELGNTQPIETVTEVWTSAELKTIVYSKRIDPIMGDDTYELSNISRVEPDPSLFTVPAGFKITDSPMVTFHQTDTQN